MFSIDYTIIRLMCFAYVGTLVGAGLFGLLAGGLAGLIMGPFLGAAVGLFVVPTVFLVSWACWFTRFPVTTSTVAGAATGLVCTVRTYDSIFAFPYQTSLLMAALLGGIGAGCAAWLSCPTGNSAPNPKRTVFSLAELFWHVTVLAATIAVWTCVISMIRESDARIEREIRGIEQQGDSLAD